MKAITLTQAAAIAHVHPDSVRNWSRKLALNFPLIRRRPDGSLEIDEDEFRRWLAIFRSSRAA